MSKVNPPKIPFNEDTLNEEITKLYDQAIEEYIEEHNTEEAYEEELDDKIVIIEKKTLYKKDMSYDQFREYGLKNVNCVKDCVSFKAPTVKNHYKEGHKHCILCNVWMIVNERNCPCCSSELRTSIKA